MTKTEAKIRRDTLPSMTGQIGGLDNFSATGSNGFDGLKAVVRKDGTLSICVIEIDSANRRQTRSTHIDAVSASRLYHALGLALQERGALVPLESLEEEAARDAEYRAAASCGLVDFDDATGSAQ